MELPRAGDPHRYVRLVLKDAPEPIAGNNQKRLALRNLAHCWLSDAGFKLTAQGMHDTNCACMKSDQTDTYSTVVVAFQWTASHHYLVVPSDTNSSKVVITICMTCLYPSRHHCSLLLICCNVPLAVVFEHSVRHISYVTM